MKSRLWVALLCVFFSLLFPRARVFAQEQTPQVAVAVRLQSSDFVVNEAKYRVFFIKSEKKTIPLTGYDFGAALTDELITALSDDKRMNWRPASEEDGIDVLALWDGKTRIPSSVQADRVFLVNVIEYGAYLTDLGKDKFFISAAMKLVDKASGKRLWQEKRMFEMTDLPGKIADLQVDDQKGLKEGINEVLEQFCRKVVLKLETKKL